MEEDIEWVVKRLRTNRSGNPSRMRAEHLRWWIWEARKAEEAIAASDGVRVD